MCLSRPCCFCLEPLLLGLSYQASVFCQGRCKNAYFNSASFQIVSHKAAAKLLKLLFWHLGSAQQSCCLFLCGVCREQLNSSLPSASLAFSSELGLLQTALLPERGDDSIHLTPLKPLVGAAALLMFLVWGQSLWTSHCHLGEFASEEQSEWAVAEAGCFCRRSLWSLLELFEAGSKLDSCIKVTLSKRFWWESLSKAL